MKVLLALTYYRPHISGVTMYAQRLAEGLVLHGHDVSVLTSRYAKSLPKRETMNGVKVYRVPVAFRISKGVIMPRYARAAWLCVRNADAIVLSLPNTPIESLFLPLLARWFRRPMIAVYHCDVALPKGFFNRIVQAVVSLSNLFSGLIAWRIVTYTRDYVSVSPFLERMKRKLVFISPPIDVADPDLEEVRWFRSVHAPREETLIGFGGRFASEKGVEYLIDALPLVQKDIPGAKVLFAGECEEVIGEHEYQEQLQPHLSRLGDRWCCLGVLDPTRMGVFLSACDVTVLPSLNRTESFGLVQVESMLCGTPVVASDLPGVRVPVLSTGMGLTVKPGNAEELAAALIEVLSHREKYVKPRAEIKKTFSKVETISEIEKLLGIGPVSTRREEQV